MFNIGVKLFVFAFICIITEDDRIKVFPVGRPNFLLDDRLEL